MEDDLVQRARLGDETAVERMVQQHQEGMFHFAYLMLGDASEAEDVVQDAFIRAFRSLDDFDSARPLRPWLLSITANLAKNRLRSAGRYWAALRHLVIAHSPSVEAENQRQSEAQALWKAVQRLKPPEQEIIYLRYFLEFSVIETAAILKVEEGTVKSRLSRALARLREVVQQDFPLLVEGRNI